MPDQLNDITAAALLAKLEDEATAKLQAIASIRSALGLPPWDGAGRSTALPVDNGTRESGAPGVIRPDEFFRMSIPDAIRKYLGIMRKPQSPKAIADGLQAGGVLSNAKKFYSNITTAIGRLDAAGILVNTPNGWGLAEWYPGRPKPTVEPKKAKKKRPAQVKKKPHKAPATAKADEKPKSPGAGDEYRAFVSEHRRAGKSLKEISQMWRAKKDLREG